MSIQNSQGSRFSHYGIEYAFFSPKEEVEAKIREFEEKREEGERLMAKPNRRAKEKPERDEAGRLARLNEELKKKLGTEEGEAIEAEINRIYKKLWRTRTKS